MAQLIQHKRGRLERLSTITGSLQKGEILIVTGSSNITSSNGSAILFAATESGSVQATNRFIIGSSAPNVFSSSVYGGLVNGVPYYDSGSGTLYLLGSDGNTPINLTGNISAFSASVATSFSASNASIASVTGDFSSSVAQTFTTQSTRITSLELFTGSYATTGSNTFKGEQIISSSLIVTNEIKGIGNIFLQPDVNDARYFQIYNTAAPSGNDIHFKGNTDFNYFGDDINYLKIDDSAQTITITGSNGVYVGGISETVGAFSQSVDSRFSASVASLNTLSSSISQSIVDIVSASLSSSLSVIATDIEVAIVSASLSSSQALISSSISTSIAETLSGSAASITSLSSSVSASLASLSASSGFISYVTNSVQNLTGIEVADYSADVAVTFVNGTLKFIFGTPLAPTSVAASLTGFATDRFNNVTDNYTVNASWNNQGYTLVSASLYEGTTLLTQVGSGTTLTYNTTTSGSHTYRLEYTASSPLDNSLSKTSTTTTGTVSKSNPAAPTLTPTTTVQLGSTSNQIEQGATGSITFTSSSANPSNNWNLTSVTTNVATPYYVTGSSTGSTSISLIATANYASPTGENNPDLTTTSTATTTYTKIRSLRYGASAATSFTAGELENIGAWDTTLGGTIGTIAKGTTTASGQSVTITHTGDKFHYIVFNSSLSNLTGITTGGFNVFNSFAVTTVGQYKVYKSTTLQAGGAGTSWTYTLT
jgi:epidermal growth factor receptor substrate 15